MTETTKMALVPVEPTPNILRSASKACRDFVSEQGQYPRSKAVHRAMLASAPNSGRVSREQLGRAAREYWSGDVDHRLYWDSMPLEGRLHEMEYMAAALRALGLEVDGE